MQRPPLYLVDASIYIFRAYYSIPLNFHDQDGNLINAVFGYCNFLVELLKSKPTFISVAFDESLNTCYRNDIYPEYKANRDLPDENLAYQLNQCQRITGLLGFHSLCLKHYEADDIIGTLARHLAADSQIIVVTRDKDLGQLLKAGDLMWDFANDRYTGVEGVQDKFGVSCEQLPDFLALAGDSVDNIPGAPGIGAKTAAKLLEFFGTLENLLDNVERISEMNIRGAKRLQSTLVTHADQVRLYRQITEINCDIPMQVSLDDVRLGEVNQADVIEFCQQMRFGDRLQRTLVQRQ